MLWKFLKCYEIKISDKSDLSIERIIYDWLLLNASHILVELWFVIRYKLKTYLKRFHNCRAIGLLNIPLWRTQGLELIKKTRVKNEFRVLMKYYFNHHKCCWYQKVANKKKDDVQKCCYGLKHQKKIQRMILFARKMKSADVADTLKISAITFSISKTQENGRWKKNSRDLGLLWTKIPIVIGLEIGCKNL